MITHIHRAACPEEYLTAAGLDPDKVIYFDIETTGFRPSTSQLYMIGWAVRDCAEERPAHQDRTDGRQADHADAGNGPAGRMQTENSGMWTVTQLMAERASEEAKLLDLFCRQLRECGTIIAFNGDRFDIPYLREKCAVHHMPDPFSGTAAVDLYQELRPCRSLLGMQKLNQKSVEQFLHITREDPYSGGELIDVYRRVRKDGCEGEEASVSALFLHNYEDVLGMLAMTPVLSYPMIRSSTAPVTWQITGPSDVQGEQSLELSFSLELPVPADIDADMGLFRLQVRKTEVRIRVPLSRRTLCHFFPDYKDYYYLPEEDRAIHRSVAGFVDPAFRRKATAANCYVKREGVFLPQMQEERLPSFRESVKDRISWFELTDAFLEDPDAVTAYAHALLAGL